MRLGDLGNRVLGDEPVRRAVSWLRLSSRSLSAFSE